MDQELHMLDNPDVLFGVFIYETGKQYLLNQYGIPSINFNFEPTGAGVGFSTGTVFGYGECWQTMMEDQAGSGYSTYGL